MIRRSGRILFALLWFAGIEGMSADRISAESVQFFGDVLLSRGIEKFTQDRGVDAVRDGIAPFLKADAVRVVNLEGSVGTLPLGANNRNPVFPISPTLLPLLDGFDIVSLQNNHSLDLGPKGLAATRRALRKRGIRALGGRDFSHVIRTEHGDVGIVAITDVVNAKEEPARVTEAGSPSVLAEISRLKKRCSFVAVYVHWGRELDDLPTSRMKELAGAFVRAGADLVVGTHTHVPGKVEIVDGRPVVYSLGNFLFDQKYAETKHGAILSCEFDRANRLVFRLTATRTPMNGFLPQRVEGGFGAENQRLGESSREITPSWTDRFTSKGRESCLWWIADKQKTGFSHLELRDPETGKLILRTPSMPIVRVQPVDVDGDGIRELYLLLKVYSSLDGEVARRVYIYSMDGKLRARWRGSALSRPLEDALFLESPERKPLLVGLHSADSFLLRDRTTKDRIIMGYQWNGFGFAGKKEKRLDGKSGRLFVQKGKVNLVDNGVIVWSAGEDLFR
jgi:poly-gamma-glutamate synthesis protein (capsule biosynthesis protein)